MNEPCDECGVDTVALLDERDQLKAKCERLEGACAEMRSAISNLIRTASHEFEGVERSLACQQGRDALSTTAGTAILARLEEARRLLEQVNQRPKWNLADWLDRRDAWLQGGQP